MCRCRRIIPAAEEVVPALNVMMDKKWVDETGVSLLTDATADAHKAALRIINSGRLSGEPPQLLSLPNACNAVLAVMNVTPLTGQRHHMHCAAS